jgi:hypothetical protein
MGIEPTPDTATIAELQALSGETARGAAGHGSGPFQQLQ